jgi:hypothetical protein
MSEPRQVRISREGQEIGTFAVDEAIRQLQNGQLKPTDFYWEEGMVEWASLSQLQASEARRILAERALREKLEKALRDKQEQEREAELLAQERQKAKEREEAVNLAVAEATRIRLEKENADRFICHCCRDSFRQPQKPGENYGCGIALILGSGVVLFFTYLIALDGYRPSPSGLSFGAWVATVCFFVGLSLFTVSNLKSPCCPTCESTNFSKPEKHDEQK